MTVLPITLITASVLGLMLVWLAGRTIASRVKNEAIIGDEGNTDLLYLIRAHGNFTEYSPIFLILLGLLEHSGANSTLLMALAATFVVARALHMLGMGAQANLKFRQTGMLLSFAAIIVSSLYGLYISVM